MFSASKTAGPSGYNINNSLRFRASASANLTRTPASAGNRKTWTWSGWVKRGTIPASDIFLFGNSGTLPISGFYFGSGNNLKYRSYNGSIEYVQLFTTPVYRDPSAWYHIVVVLDTTQATASNRLKFYVNGVQVTVFDTATYPSLNSDEGINATTIHDLGSYAQIYVNLDGYLAEVNFIDGQALTPSSFGSTNATTGVWQPAKYTGTYGTNGFYLKFSDIGLTSGSNTGLGKDFSGNSNYWTTNNISVTAGTTYDAMTDVPTLTSATVANYAVMNPLVNYGSVSMVLSSANLNWTSNQGQSSSTIGMPSGKWYCEIVYSTINSTLSEVGILNDSGTYAVGYRSNGTKDVDSGSNNSSYGASYTTGDIIGIAIDADAKTAVFYKNNVSQGTITFTIAGPYYFFVTDRGASNSAGSVNFGQRPFAYTPPSGFNRLNTFNLPTSTIVKGNTVMDATLYTGNGGTQSVVNAAGFKPDFVWYKQRNTTRDNGLEDSVRGTSKIIISNSTATEVTASGITGFNSNGFSIGNNVIGNESGGNYVGWQWQAGQGTTSSNTAGSITSTTSVSTTAGFSVITWSGNSTSGATIGHGLGVAPKMFIVKVRNRDEGWVVGHTSIGWSNFLQLNNTNASASSAFPFNNTAPSSTLITLGSGSGTNGSTYNYVGYAWAEIAGFSKFGSYTGNGSSDGPFIYLGFRPRWVMWKNASAVSYWWIMDSSIDPYNPNIYILAPNANIAEYTDSNLKLDFLSNGFKPRTLAGNEVNGSGNTIIYAAFAENPFKNALAR